MAQTPNQGQSGNQTSPVNKKRFKLGCVAGVVVALLPLIGVIVAAIFPGIQLNVCWGGIYGSLCHPTTSTSTARYNFENDAQNWELVGTQPSEKQSRLQLVKGQGYNNSQGSLEIDTLIWGSQNAPTPGAGSDVYTHTAVRVFFDDENDTDKKVSCHLYFPDPPPTKVYFRLFAITDKQDTDYYEYGQAKLYPETVARNTWVELSMVIGASGNEGQRQFDPTHVNYIGMNIQDNGGPNMDKTPVKVLLDDCTIS